MTGSENNEGWNMPLALGVLGVLGILAILMVIVAMRIFDAFDPVTEMLIGAIFIIGFLGVNGAVIWYLNSMKAPTSPVASSGEKEESTHG